MSEDVVMHTSACGAFSGLSDGPNERIEEVLRTGVLPRLVALLESTDTSTQRSALRTIGNMATGSASQTQQVMDANMLPALHKLLHHENKHIRKESCWLISNISADTDAHIQQLLDMDIFPKVIQMLVTDEWEVQQEAAWAVSNATTCGTTAQKICLANLGVLPPLIKLLKVCRLPKPKDAMANVILEGVANLLEAGQTDDTHAHGENPVTRLLTMCNGFAEVRKWKLVPMNMGETLPHMVKTRINQILEYNPGRSAADDDDEDDEDIGDDRVNNQDGHDIVNAVMDMHI
jgi:hypothetical protein